MGSVTTAFPDQEKADLLSALHCYNGNIVFQARTVSGSTKLDTVTALTGLAVGMSISGPSIAAGALIASFDATTILSMGAANGVVPTATGSGASLTFTALGDLFYMPLLIATVTGTYGTATTNYSNVTGNSDEVPNGSGYTTGGMALTNVTPVLNTHVGFVNYSPNPSWTSATFSTSGCIIYNKSQRGPLANQAVYVGSFGGVQTVAAGTLTVLMPSATSSTAILRIQ